MAKTKALISFAVTAKLICVFVFAYAKSRFSHNEAHIKLRELKRETIYYLSFTTMMPTRHFFLFFLLTVGTCTIGHSHVFLKNSHKLFLIKTVKYEFCCARQCQIQKR